MDRVMKFLVLSIKQGLFMDVKGKLSAPSRKRAVFLDAEVAQKRDTLERMSP
ncbi:MAG: hypothetical protein J6R30_06275 [Bacteroidales bacterium]|nr:hypothetical protein [Bacteroidales bacterium]